MPPGLHQRSAIAAAIVAGRAQLTVVAAMSPQQPDELLHAILSEARSRGVRVRLLCADLTGRFGFLDASLRESLASGALEIVTLAGAVPRELAEAVDHLPHSLWDIDRQFRCGILRADVFVARVHLTDDESRLSFGQMVGYSEAAMTRARVIAVDVAPALAGFTPWLLSASNVDLVHHDRDYVAPAAGVRRGHTPEQRLIADRIGDLLPLGATVQVGLGATPEAVVGALADRPDLGLHTGVIPAGAATPIRRGALAGGSKRDDPGLQVATGVMAPAGDDGTTWPASVQVRPVSRTHSAEVLRRIDGLWAINSAFDIDLAGNANAEYVNGIRVASGAGQTDFFRAAHISHSGRSVLAMTSRTIVGDSRIRRALAAPGICTTQAGDIDIVVTEHGAETLTGLANRDRAEALISIAHPDDRVTLARDVRPSHLPRTREGLETAQGS